MSKLYTAKLADWKIEDCYGVHRLVGTVASDDIKGRFEVGDVIHTSAIKSINFETMVARTLSGSIYLLM